MRRIKRYTLRWFVLISGMILCTGCVKEEQVSLKEKPVEEMEVEASPNEQTVIFVYVCGAVNMPGVYELPEGSRLYEAIEAAGGMNEEADKNNSNQAEVLIDAQRVYIPTMEETNNSQASLQMEAVDDGKVELNTASKEELMTLPGIGEAKAASIIKYREQQGRFTSIEDIKQIAGIKEGVFEKIEDKIAVR